MMGRMSETAVKTRRRVVVDHRELARAIGTRIRAARLAAGPHPAGAGRGPLHEGLHQRPRARAREAVDGGAGLPRPAPGDPPGPAPQRRRGALDPSRGRSPPRRRPLRPGASRPSTRLAVAGAGPRAPRRAAPRRRRGRVPAAPVRRGGIRARGGPSPAREGGARRGRSAGRPTGRRACTARSTTRRWAAALLAGAARRTGPDEGDDPGFAVTRPDRPCAERVRPRERRARPRVSRGGAWPGGQPRRAAPSDLLRHRWPRSARPPATTRPRCGPGRRRSRCSARWATTIQAASMENDLAMTLVAMGALDRAEALARHGLEALRAARGLGGARTRRGHAGHGPARARTTRRGPSPWRTARSRSRPSTDRRASRSAPGSRGPGRSRRWARRSARRTPGRTRWTVARRDPIRLAAQAHPDRTGGDARGARGGTPRPTRSSPPPSDRRGRPRPSGNPHRGDRGRLAS